MRRIEWLVPAILCLTMLTAATTALAFNLKVNPVQMSTVIMDVIPDRVAPEGVVTLNGFGLRQSMVGDVYLMDTRGNHRVEILEQTNTLLRFRVPVDMSAGRKRLVIERIMPGDDLRGNRQLQPQDFFVTIDPELADPPPTSVIPTGL